NSTRMKRRTNHRGASFAGMVLLLMPCAPAAWAIDSIVLEVQELEVGGIPVTGAGVRLDLLSDQQTRVSVAARQVRLPDPAGTLSDVTLVCDRPVIAEPRFGCDDGRLRARGGPTGAVDMQVRAEMRTDSGVTTFAGKGLKLAGTSASFDGRMDDKGWRVS